MIGARIYGDGCGAVPRTVSTAVRHKDFVVQPDQTGSATLQISRTADIPDNADLTLDISWDGGATWDTGRQYGVPILYDIDAGGLYQLRMRHNFEVYGAASPLTVQDVTYQLTLAGPPILVDIINGKNGQIYGGERVAGKFGGRAIYLDGTDYIELPAIWTPTVPDDFSFAFWIKTTAADGVILTYGALQIRLDSGQVKTYNGTTLSAALSPAINDGDWHSIVMTYDDASNTVTVYPDADGGYGAIQSQDLSGTDHYIGWDGGTSYCEMTIDDIWAVTGVVSLYDAKNYYRAGDLQTGDFYAKKIYARKMILSQDAEIWSDLWVGGTLSVEGSFSVNGDIEAELWTVSGKNGEFSHDVSAATVTASDSVEVTAGGITASGDIEGDNIEATTALTAPTVNVTSALALLGDVTIKDTIDTGSIEVSASSSSDYTLSSPWTTKGPEKTIILSAQYTDPLGDVYDFASADDHRIEKKEDIGGDITDIRIHNDNASDTRYYRLQLAFIG